MTEPHSPRLILASASPRRRTLLETLGLKFEVIPADFDEESVTEEMPDELVAILAQGKANAVSADYPKELVIGADTVVVLEGEVLGKPKDPDEAVAMLTRLSGRTHEVKTGVSIVLRGDGYEETFVETTKVTFGRLSDELIRRYVETKEPMDKAGAYGIQEIGATLVSGVNGCYFNVVGLPLFRLARSLASVGIQIP